MKYSKLIPEIVELQLSGLRSTKLIFSSLNSALTIPKALSCTVGLKQQKKCVGNYSWCDLATLSCQHATAQTTHALFYAVHNAKGSGSRADVAGSVLDTLIYMILFTAHTNTCFLI